ncbi:MAG: fimbrillin family protein [Proteiniphilum sp.]
MKHNLFLFKSTFSFFILMCLTLASCSDHDNTKSSDAQGEITFISGLNTPVTRISLDGNQWIAGDAVGIYMLATATATVVNHTNVPYKAESSATVTAFKADSEPIYYPENGAAVDFMAYYPYSSTITNFLYPINLTDQSVDMTVHDLMRAKMDNGGHGYTTGPVSFTFEHQLAKVTLKFVDHSGSTVMPTKVTIKGMNTVADYNLSTGVLGEGATAADITPYQSNNTCSAILLPFTVGASHQITATVNNKSYSWQINDHYSEMQIKAGYAYVFNIKVNAYTEEMIGQLVDVSNNSVAPWSPKADDDGIEEPFTDLDLGLPTTENDDLVRAFPGAEGGGMYTTGGRGGKVIKVTNLNDSGTGSLRAALSESGTRTIVFDVSGVIELKSRLNINNGNVTIAGQTAPGDGICLKNYSAVVNGSNVIIRFVRFRMGDEANFEDDALWGRFTKDVIIDHCSMSWSTDECSSFYANENFTMQWCILSESLRNSVHDKGIHGYGAISGGVNASYHHNLLAHHDSRNPRFDSGEVYGSSSQPLTTDKRAVDFRNCVVYNYSNYPAYGGDGQKINFVGNYYKWGPASINGPDVSTNGKKRGYFYLVGGINAGVDYGCPHIYMGENTNYLHTDGTFNHVNSDNWAGISYSSDPGSTTVTKLTTPVSIAPSGTPARVTSHTAATGFEKVLAYAGASLKRDAVDKRAVNDTRNGTATCMNGGNGSINGLIDTQAAVGGWPTYKSERPRKDSDGDGIPDAWEDAFGLDKNSDADGNTKTLDPRGRYTNLEIYLHYLIKHIVADQNVEGTYISL